jgi:hypothetical protein
MADEKRKDDVVPANMSGFTILQILSWTNAEIEKCREKLEVEPSGRIVAYLQGKIPGCKFAIKKIREIFGFTDPQFDHLEQPVEFGALSIEQILGAEKDMKELEKNELWGSFLSIVDLKVDEMKDFLLKRAKKSRELDEYQGEYQGMIHYEKVFQNIQDQVVFWKTSLFKKGDDNTEQDSKDAGDQELLMAPALPPPEDEYPPSEEYEEPDERLEEELPDEGEIIEEEDPDMDFADAGNEPA